MLRALLWKEWREQRLVAGAGLALAALMPFIIEAASRLSSRRDVSDLMPQALIISYALFLWPMLAAVTAGATIANEVGDRTIDFLFSRPVRHSTIWGVKVAMAIASFATIFMGSILVLLLRGLRPLAEIPMPALDLSSVTGLALLIVVSAVGLIFASSLFFSTLVSRSLQATLLGIAFAVLLLSCIIMLSSRFDLSAVMEPQWVAVDIALAALLLTLSSLILFTREESLRDAATRRLGLVGLAVTAIAALVLVPFAYGQRRLGPGSALLAEPRVSPARDAIAVTAVSRSHGAPEAWLVRPDRGGVQRMGGRLTFSPAVSPDGRLVAYFSRRNLLGMVSEQTSLRLVASDGSGDHVLAEDLGPLFPGLSQPPVFSPTGDQIALLSEQLLVVSVDGRGRSAFDLPSRSRAWIAGWSNDKEVVVLQSSYEGQSPATLTAISISDGRSRILFSESGASAWLPARWSSSSSKGQSVIPLVVRGRGTDSGAGGLAFVTIGEKPPMRVSARPCWGVATVSHDGGSLAYASCPDPRIGDVGAEIHVVDPETGVDRIIGSVSRTPVSVLISPSGEDLALGLFDRAMNQHSVAIMDRKGAVIDLPGAWEPVGWLARDRLVIGRALNEPGAQAPSHLAVADASTGSIHEIFP